MKPELRYIELKTGFSDNGPAWIGWVEFSKSGQRIYFNGQAFKRSGGQGMAGNDLDLETGYEYWVSGIKKKGTNRLHIGGGKIKIDRNAVEQYTQLVNIETLEKGRFDVCDIILTDKQRFVDQENAKID